jgi:hypothetical protein
VVSLGAAFLASCGQEEGIYEPPPWVCTGTVFDNASGQPLVGTQFWVEGFQQRISDSSGSYHAILGFERSDVDTIRFTMENYHDTVALLDTARAIASHHLAMDIRMVRLEDPR